MSTASVISVSNLSKGFSVYKKPSDLLVEFVQGKPRHDVFWALRDISFELKEGQRLGIIGSNGAGKSTLLRLIAGNLMPSSGSVSVTGEVSSMLSLNSFLNDDETGIENIKFNLMLRDVPESQISTLTEEIVEFTELGDFIYSPVRTYSSGMNARLAFAISTSVAPDILIVDEVLSVGDGYFVGKATQRMLDLCARGRGLLYVSHSMAALRLLCDTALWLENGTVRQVGSVNDVVAEYEDDYRRREDETARAKNKARVRELERTVREEELEDADRLRFRLVSNGKPRLHRTHYVRRVGVSCGELHGEAPLELVPSEEPETAAQLDIFTSEWGRMHTREGQRCRMLAPATRRLKGGQLTLSQAWLEGLGDSPSVEFHVESASVDENDELVLEHVTVDTGEWVTLERTSYEQLSDGWWSSNYRGTVSVGTPQQRQLSLERARNLAGPTVEILGTKLIADGREFSVVSERRPFRIEVTIRAHFVVEMADVVLKIERSDGVYAFWQSSGLVGQNLCNLQGEKLVAFCFDENYFGHGEYHVSIFVANGWDVETNFPYSEVYDRQISDLMFKVLREHDKVDTALLNQQVRVEVSAVSNEDKLLVES